MEISFIEKFRLLTLVRGCWVTRFALTQPTANSFLPWPSLFLHLTCFDLSPLFHWSQSGSNRRPPACKADALPAELWPPSLLHPLSRTRSVTLFAMELNYLFNFIFTLFLFPNVAARHPSYVHLFFPDCLRSSGGPGWT